MRWLRRAGIVVGALVGAALLIVLIATGLLYTHWGQEQVRARAERELDALLAGDVTVMATHFGLDGNVRVEGLVVMQGGQRVASVASVAAKIDLAQVIQGRVVAPEVVIDGLFVDTRVELLAPRDDSEDEPEDEASASGEDPVQIGRFVVTNASVIVDDRGQARTIEGIEAVATWRGDEVAVVDAGARVDGVRVQSAMAAANLATGEISVFARVAGNGASLASLARQPNWLADVDLELAATRASGTAPWRVTAAGAIAASDVAVMARVDPLRSAATAQVRATAVAPATVWRDAPAGTFDVAVRVGDGKTLVALASEPVDIVVTGRGEVEGIAVQRFAVHAAGTRADASVRFDARTPRGPLTASARGSMPAGVESIRVEQAKLAGDITAFVRMIESAPRMASAVVSVTGSGAVTSLDVAGDVDIRSLRDGTTRVRSLAGRVVVHKLSALDLSQPMAGALDVTLRGVDEAGRRIEFLRADGQFWDGGDRFALDITARGLPFADEVRGDVVVARGGTRTSLSFGEVVAKTGAMAWRGNGGRVAVDDSGRIQVDEVALRSDAGTVQVDGVLQPARRRRAEGALRIRTEDFSLERAAPAFAFFGVQTPLSGTVSARVDLSRRSRDLDIEGRVVYEQVAWGPDTPALTGNLDLALGARELVLKGELARHGAEARATWLVQTRAPAQTLDVDAWRGLDIGDIVESRVTVRNLDAALVESVLGKPAGALGATGVARADIEFPHDGVREIGLDLRVNGVTYGELAGVDVAFDGAWNDRKLAGTVTLAHGGAPVVSASVGAGVGVQDLWRRRGDELIDRPITASAAIRDFDLRRIERAKITSQPLIGKFSGDINVTGTARAPRVTLDRGAVVGLRAAGIPFERLRIDASYAGNEVRGHLRAAQSAGGSIAVEGGYDLADGTVAANVTSTGFDLQVLRVFAVDNVDPLSVVSGKLDADVHVSGPPAEIAVNGTVKLRNGQVLVEGGSRQLEDINAVVELRGDHALVQMLELRSGEGTASATGQVDFDGLAFSLDIVASKIPVVAGAYVAAIDLDGTLTGRQTDAGFEAQASVFDGLVTLSGTGRELQAIGSLEDVVIVDRLGSGAKSGRAGGGDRDALLIRLQVFVINQEGIRIKSREFDARVAGDMTIEYQGQLSSVRGGLEARSGQVVLFDERYEIVDAWADFDGSVPMNPDIYAELRRTFPAATVTIIAQGTVEDTQIAFSSDVPDYDEPQILSIMLGQDPDDTNISETGPQERAGRVALNLVLAQTRAELGLPIDVARTYEDGFEIGKWLSDRMLLGYRYRDESGGVENSQEIRLEYRILRNLVFEGVAGNEDIHGADLLYILRF